VVQVCVPYGSRGTRVCATSAALSLEACTAGSTRACYTGPGARVGIGRCRAGRQRCGADGSFGGCEGEVLPEAEICGDGLDQDCDRLDVACEPCPRVGTCAVDDDPCTAESCVEGECRQDRPLGWALLECRDAALGQAVASLAASCPDPAAARTAARYGRRLSRVLAAIERLARRAREIGQGRGCIARLARARLKTGRLNQLLNQAASRQALCAALPDTLARRIDDVAAAIVTVSACRPTF
jgi:hypothetical protein